MGLTATEIVGSEMSEYEVNVEWFNSEHILKGKIFTWVVKGKGDENISRKSKPTFMFI
jgi:hypothetical protein